MSKYRGFWSFAPVSEGTIHIVEANNEEEAIEKLGAWACKHRDILDEPWDFSLSIILLKDAEGNLWLDEGIDEQSKLHKVTVVEEDEGSYLCTSITWYMTDEEYAQTTQIQMEVA